MMTNLRVGECFLKLHENLETGQILYNRAPLTVQFIQGELEVQYQPGQDSSTPCVVYKIMRHRNPAIFNHYSSRLSRSVDLPPQHFVRGKLSFYDVDDDAMYFCYEKYDMNFMKYMSHQHDVAELKKVVRGFFEALCYLHENNTMHGDLHYTNLVIINGSGFLSGGIAPKDNKDLKIDLTCIVDNIERCYIDNFKPLDEETRSLFDFIRSKKTTDFLLHHPFLLTPKLKKEFCINAVKFVQAMDKDMFSSCGKVKLLADLMKYCRIKTKTYHGCTHHKDWTQNVNSNMRVYQHFDVDAYGSSCAYSFMRFARNVHAHCKVNHKETMSQHEEEIQAELDFLWPDALCHVHMAFYSANDQLWKYLG